MNRTIHHILSNSCRLMAMGLLATLVPSCSDDLANELAEPTAKTYTLTLAIDADDPDSRTEQTDMPVKRSWVMGDKVTLQQDKPHAEYEFVVTSINADGVATFTHTGDIPNANNFTGQLIYVGPAATYVYPWGTTEPATEDDKIESYRVQASNGNADHINSLDNLTAKLDKYDLTTAGTIHMERSYVLLKIMLRGFIYPISQGSVLYISGFDKYNIGKEETPLGLVLGNWTNHRVTTGADGHETLVDDPANPDDDPFFKVSDQKDPMTTYAVDDGRTLVAYVPIADSRSRTMLANHKLAITLIDYWSRDAYVWSVMAPDEIKYELNHTYTLDLTYMEPDIAIEAVMFKHSSLWDAKPFGYVRTKNIGAATPTDEGFFFLFGHEERIYPGRHYPSYPRKGPYFYLQSDPGYGNGEAVLSSKDLTDHSNNPDTYYCNYLNTDVLEDWSSTAGTLKINKSKFGELWYKTLSDQFKRVHNGMKSSWGLPHHMGKNQFEKDDGDHLFYTTEMVNSSGLTAQKKSEVVGMRMTINRTGHVLYFPACGMLKPSKTIVENDIPYIDYNAVAERTTEYGNVVFMQDHIQIVDNAGKREPTLMLDSFDFDPSCAIGNGRPKRRNAPLCVATTVRPAYMLYRTDLAVGINMTTLYNRYPIILMMSTLR